MNRFCNILTMETEDRGKVQQLVSENTNRPTVLVIDDNTDIRQYERTLLQDEYIVLEAADGKEGLAVAIKGGA